MAEIICERLTDEFLEPFQEFCRHNWGGEHPLIHNEEMFDYYYRDGDLINVVIAIDEKTEDVEPVDFLRQDKIVEKPRLIHGVCGFIKSNSGPTPDVFASYLLAGRDTQFGISFKLLENVRKITNCRTIASNNIRKKTRGIYDFLEYVVDDMRQWYRLNPDVAEYRLADIYSETVPDVAPNTLAVAEVSEPDELEDFPFFEFHADRPYKDLDYFKWRFFNYPWHDYRVFRLNDGERQALLVLREIESDGATALRVADFFGARALIGKVGGFLDDLLKKSGAEFVDWYEYGVDEEQMAEAGMLLRYTDDSNIIPLYLTPLLLKNVDITVYMSDADGYMMFRADGDQDRPNLG